MEVRNRGYLKLLSFNGYLCLCFPALAPAPNFYLLVPVFNLLLPALAFSLRLPLSKGLAFYLCLSKVSRGFSPEIVNELSQFEEQIPYELRQRPQFQIPWIHSVFSATESLKFLGPKISALVPNEMKQLIAFYITNHIHNLFDNMNHNISLLWCKVSMPGILAHAKEKIKNI